MERLINTINTDEDTTVVHRIAYVYSYLIGQADLDPQLKKGLEKLLEDMFYHPLWDEEQPIHDDLNALVNLCYLYRPNDAELAKVYQTPLTPPFRPAALGLFLN